MGLVKLRIAVATKGHEGLEDTVSEVFGRATTFTILDVSGKEVKNIEVLNNPAVSYKHGAGPIVTKMLIDSGVNAVIASEFGPGVSILLDQHNITKIVVKPGIRVAAAIKNTMQQIQSKLGD